MSLREVLRGRVDDPARAQQIIDTYGLRNPGPEDWCEEADCGATYHDRTVLDRIDHACESCGAYLLGSETCEMGLCETCWVARRDGCNHSAVHESDRCFTGPVSRQQNQAAHGGITRTETCRCGATRRVNVNGRHEEAGDWEAAT